MLGSRILLAALALATAALSLPTQPMTPFVGAPHGDIFRSNDELECDLLRVTFGGGEGPPYSINFVSPPPSNNASVDDVEVLDRLGVMGMPGFTWWDVDSSNLKVGDVVALQIIDRVGQVGYSVNRRVAEARLNEYCHYPGAFWPPSRWDGTHFSIMLVAIFLGIPFTVGFLSGMRESWAKSRAAARLAAREASANAGVQLQERSSAHAAGAEGERQHVLGEDDERTSLEDEDRPLLRADGQADEPSSAPPGYDEAVKEGTGDDVAGERRV